MRQQGEINVNEISVGEYPCVEFTLEGLDFRDRKNSPVKLGHLHYFVEQIAAGMEFLGSHKVKTVLPSHLVGHNSKHCDLVADRPWTAGR